MSHLKNAISHWSGLRKLVMARTRDPQSTPLCPIRDEAERSMNGE